MAHLRNVSFAGVSGEISFDDNGDRKISDFTIETLNRPRSTNPACCDGSAIQAATGATANARGRYNRLACASDANDFCCINPEDDTVGPLYCTTDGAAHAAAEGTVECPAQDGDEFHSACPAAPNPTWQTYATMTATTISADGGNSTGPLSPAPPWFDGTEVPFDFVEVSEVGCKEGSDCIGSRHGPYCYKDGGCDHLECLGECRWDTGDIKCGTAMGQGARPHPPLHVAVFCVVFCLHVAVFRCLLRTRDLCCASHLRNRMHIRMCRHGNDDLMHDSGSLRPANSAPCRGAPDAVRSRRDYLLPQHRQRSRDGRVRLRLPSRRLDERCASARWRGAAAAE